MGRRVCDERSPANIVPEALPATSAFSEGAKETQEMAEGGIGGGQVVYDTIGSYSDGSMFHTCRAPSEQPVAMSACVAREMEAQDTVLPRMISSS